jgi:hypothetical protein
MALVENGLYFLHLNTQSVIRLNSIKSKIVRRFEIEMIFLNFLKIINCNWRSKIIFIYLSTGYIKIKVEQGVIFNIKYL